MVCKIMSTPKILSFFHDGSATHFVNHESFPLHILTIISTLGCNFHSHWSRTLQPISISIIFRPSLAKFLAMMEALSYPEYNFFSTTVAQSMSSKTKYFPYKSWLYFSPIDVILTLTKVVPINPFQSSSRQRLNMAPSPVPSSK